MRDPRRTLDEAAELIEERGKDYGGIEDNFQLAALIFNSAGGPLLSPCEIALILASVKLARLNGSPNKRDNFLDCINYLAFACELRRAE